MTRQRWGAGQIWAHLAEFMWHRGPRRIIDEFMTGHLEEHAHQLDQLIEGV